MKLELYVPVLKKLVRVRKGYGVQTPCHRVIEERKGASQEMALEAIDPRGQVLIALGGLLNLR